MDSLLHISQSKPLSEVREDNLVPVGKTSVADMETAIQSLNSEISNAADALSILQGQPVFERLSLCLEWLAKQDQESNIRVPGPTSTQIISVLVDEIIPNYWTILRTGNHLRERKWLNSCLRSVSGIGAITARLKFALNDSTDSNSTSEASRKSKAREYLEVLDSVLHGSVVLVKLWSNSSTSTQKHIQKQLMWKELISLLASGRLVSIAAQALALLDEEAPRLSWLGESSSVSSWLGENIRMLVLSSHKHGEEIFSHAASIFGRGLSLGYPVQLVEAFFRVLLNGNFNGKELELLLFKHLSVADRTKTFSAIQSILNQKFLTEDKTRHRKLISGASALLKLFVDQSLHLQSYLVNWLACISGGGVGSELSMRRAATATISSYDTLLEEALQKLLTQFGDKIHIQHAPIILQEVCSQNLLLLIGRMFRKDASSLKTIARSSIFINAISRRLAASSERPRALGMIIGMAVSELVDDMNKRMKFTGLIDDTDVEWYMELTGIQDEIGAITDLVGSTGQQTEQSKPELSPAVKQSIKSQKIPTTNAVSKIIAIEEISSDEEYMSIRKQPDSDEDDLPLYEKPDSDAEDSDDDPTLVNRNKPVPPVYIRDLITYLRDTENYDRHVLALSHATELIRRKSFYGTEVTDHIEDLASLLCGLKDEHDIESWQQQRVAAMVAIILAQPTTMGRWFANMIFSGDYSISQRASMLTAVALAARELAGYASEDAGLTKAPDSEEELFPSKQLPLKYAKLYAQSTSAITYAAQNLENRILQPIAAQALDKSNPAPSILKTRTFSSRLAVESRKKPVNNKLPALLADNLFFPLTNRWQTYLLMHSSTNTNGPGNVFSTPFLHAHFLKTLALLLAAGGKSTLALPVVTDEFWTILLAAQTRTAASEALPVLEAVLFALLTLLDINGAGIEGEDRQKRRLAEDCGEKLIETQAWVGVIMERIGAGSSTKGLSKEEDRVKMLAAGILIRVEEVVEQYQRLLMGSLASV